MGIRIERPRSEEGLAELLRFHDRVYEARSARHVEYLPLTLPILLGRSPFNQGREILPLVAYDDDVIVARGVAVDDARYRAHWNEPTGHLVWFEALPGSREAVGRLVDEAARWLAGRGLEAMRAGMGLLEMPFVIDDYESLPPLGVRQNPAYYHALLKDAGFETEQGYVDYKIRVTPERVTRYRKALEGARHAGYELRPFGEIPAAERIRDFTSVHNESFRRHRGFTPFLEEELATLLAVQEPVAVLETSVLAYRDGRPVGMVWAVPEISRFTMRAPRRSLDDAEKVNFLGIGVVESERGRGLNLAMAAHAYLRMIEAGARYLSYTIVLDDNWPSRRTAEKLGAFVCASYVAYRRNLTASHPHS